MNSHDNILREGQINYPCPSHLPKNSKSCPTQNQINSTIPPIPIFPITQESLAKLVEHNNICSLHEVVAALKTNVETGIHGDGRDLSLRHEAFGSNKIFEENPRLAMKGFHRFVLESFKDTTNLILLLCCATLSMVIGIKKNGPEEGFRDGAIVFLAIFLVVIFGSVFRVYKARMMMRKKVSCGKDVVGVIRAGKMQHVLVSEIVVGDIVFLEAGDRIPADGLYIHGDSIKINDGVVRDFSKYPTMFTGAKVVEGYCKMVVISVGRNTERSRLMRSISSTHPREVSKLQASIDDTNTRLEKVWLSLSLILLSVQVIRCFIWKSKCDENHDPDPTGLKSKVEEIMSQATKIIQKQNREVNGGGLLGMLCVLVFAMRDGLPLGILIFLAYASKKMKFCNATVRNLHACATAGLVTGICTGETSDLTLQHTKIAELWIGLDSIKKEVCTGVLNTLREGVCMNSSSPSDDVLLWWARQGLGTDIEELNGSCTVVHNEGVDLDRKRSGLSLRRNGEVGNIVHVHWKGDPEMVLSMCSHYYDVHGTMQTLEEHNRENFQKIISSVASGSLKCFAFAYKHIIIQEEENLQEKVESLKPIDEDGLTWIGLVGLKNPYPPEVREAIKDCVKLGGNLRLMVGDDIKTARLIGINSGILRPGEETKEAVIEASEFRNSSEEERVSMIDSIRVMANTTPADKLLMVQCLRQKDEVVAVAGNCIRDSPALKEADIGLFVSDNDGAAAKEDADIFMLDLNFKTICEILKLGKCVCNNLEKFVQVQITLNISAFILNFILVASTNKVPLSPFKLLWVNVIMDVLGAMAFAATVAEPPYSPTQSESYPPVYGEGPAITKAMWRNIAVQSLYQITVLLILDLKGKPILHVDEAVLQAMVFNCYVLCQISVLLEMEKINVSEGIRKDYLWFLVIAAAIVVLQEVAIEMAAVVAHTGRLDLKQWCICIGIAAVSVIIDWAAKWFLLYITKFISVVHRCTYLPSKEHV